MKTEPDVGPDLEPIERRLLEFLRGDLLAREDSLGPDDDLLTGDLLDSIAVLRLATFVTEEFAFEIQPADFVIENFRTVRVLAGYVRRATAESS